MKTHPNKPDTNNWVMEKHDKFLLEWGRYLSDEDKCAITDTLLTYHLAYADAMAKLDQLREDYSILLEKYPKSSEYLISLHPYAYHEKLSRLTREAEAIAEKVRRYIHLNTPSVRTPASFKGWRLKKEESVEG